MMLPLDTLSPQVNYAFEACGVKEEDVTLVLNLDLDISGDCGEGLEVLAVFAAAGQNCKRQLLQ
jgi:hypothetical protein